MEGNMENINLENNEETISSKDNLADILEIKEEHVIEITEIEDMDSDIEEDNEVKVQQSEEVKVSRDNYTEDEIKNKICIICGKTNCRGIIILDKKICLECEEKAINADIKSAFYLDYKDKIIKNVVGKFKKQNLG